MPGRPDRFLTPAQRSLRAALANAARLAAADPSELTAAATAANPGQLKYWYSAVDPDGTLAPEERDRRAEAARRAHYLQLAYKSSRSRAKAKKAAS